MLKNRFYLVGIIIITILIVSLGAYFLLRDNTNSHSDHSASDEVMFYTCGMHPDVHVSVDEYEKGNDLCPICNMKLIPVLKENEMVSDKTTDKKILFYRNPMNPSITSKEPAKDEMGMDYIPVYEEGNGENSYYGCGMEGEEHVFLIKNVEGMKCPICGMPLKKLTKGEADNLRGVAGRVKIKGKQMELAGAEMEPVKMLSLFKEIQTVGRVAYDSDLAIAEEEYVSALHALDKMEGGSILEIKKRASSLVNSAEKKLKLLGLSDEQIVQLGKSRKVHSNLVLPETKMWIYGDVYEYELSWLSVDQKIKVISSAYPGIELEGIITSINPTVDPKTRSVRFRAEIDNPDLKLKPDMYVDITIMSKYNDGKNKETVLAIPKSAVLDTGVRKIVWFDKGDGLYEGREIVIGPEASVIIDGKILKYYPIIRGAREGEMVVTKANFLVDSQSQISGTASSAYGGALEAEEKDKPAGHNH